MKGKSVQTVLVIIVSAAIFMFPACLHSSLFTGVKLLSTDLSFENPDQDDTVSYQPGQSKAFVSTALTFKSPPGTILSDQITRLWLLVSFPDQKASLLRC
jgi:hypothetical protein